MRSFRFGLASLIVLGAVVAFVALSIPTPAFAIADECRASCQDAKRTCARTAKTAARSCKEVCRGAASRRDCRRACRSALVGARDVCVDAREGCRDACDFDPPPPSECEHCLGELRVCLHGISHEGRACVSECISSRRTEARACRNAANPISCLLQVARSAARCLHGCSRHMHVGAKACQAGHEDCRSACQGGGGGPYGSASQAFLAPPANLLE